MKIKTGIKSIDVYQKENTDTILFREIPMGTKFIVNDIMHKKISSTATYGYSVKNRKNKRGIYSFNPETKLLITKK